MTRCNPDEKDCPAQTAMDQAFLRQANGNNETFDDTYYPYATGDKYDCESKMLSICKFSRFCGHSKEASILCNQTMYLCVNLEKHCDGIEDCLLGDSSDEFRCFFPYMKNTLFVIVALFVACLTTVCSFNHKSSLRKNNMVRFKGDVLKRKDVIKAKKNKDNLLERDSSNEVISEKTKSLAAPPPSAMKKPLPQSNTTTSIVSAASSSKNHVTIDSPKKNSVNTISKSVVKKEVVNVESAPPLTTTSLMMETPIVGNKKEEVMSLNDEYLDREVEGIVDTDDEKCPFGYGYRFEYRNYN